MRTAGPAIERRQQRVDSCEMARTGERCGGIGTRAAGGPQRLDAALLRVGADLGMEGRALVRPTSPMSPSSSQRGAGSVASTSIAARTESGLAL